ncbi:hypothetical protein BB560_005363 [Smittium megazygosporum]|uniref:polynucleotide adenylyltransferase n=1 Tax=Smittium megazygosporum TaxID=133381 RepID=A0A2T9Z6R2_9FUNG|nr:hypothetical protein BB560_005363 [Smittium megazygosporum]
MSDSAFEFIPLFSFNDSEDNHATAPIDIPSSPEEHPTIDKSTIPNSHKRKHSQIETDDPENQAASDSSSLWPVENKTSIPKDHKLDKSSLAGYDGKALPLWFNSPKINFNYSDKISELLNKEVKYFTEYISPTPEEAAIRSWVLEKLRKSLSTIFKPHEKKRIEVVCFGSYVTGLYLPTSDLDISACVIDTVTNRMCQEFEDLSLKRKLLYSIARVLRKTGFSEHGEVIANARVPIVKTVESSSRISIDISINSIGGLKAAKIVNFFLEEEFPVVLRSLALIIKVFMQQRGMNEVYSGGLGSYATIMMLVSFLQLHPKIQSAEIDPKENIGVLLCEFFELYGKKFNYDKVGIVIRKGGRYIRKPINYNRTGRFNSGQTERLYIEDPNDPTNDITQGTFALFRIRQYFSGAFDMLTNSMFKYNQVLKFGKPLSEKISDNKESVDQKLPKKKRVMLDRNSTNVQNNDTSYNKDLPVSFLSCVISVNKQLVSRRRRLAELFYSNAFQGVLGTALNSGAQNPNSTEKNKKNEGFGSGLSNLSSLDIDFSLFRKAKNGEQNVSQYSIDSSINFEIPSSPEYIMESEDSSDISDSDTKDKNHFTGKSRHDSFQFNFKDRYSKQGYHSRNENIRKRTFSTQNNRRINGKNNENQHRFSNGYDNHKQNNEQFKRKIYTNNLKSKQRYQR